MAEFGEWTLKGATLSEVTAQKEYGISRAFIIKGIQDGKLEYREGAMHGNPYLRILRSQLEALIKLESGEAFLSRNKNEDALRKVTKEIKEVSKKLEVLQNNKLALEAAVPAPIVSI